MIDKKILKIIISLSLGVLLAVGFFYFKNNNFVPSSVKDRAEKNKKDATGVKLQVLDYPQEVKDICQQVEMKLKITNNSEEEITFDAIKKGNLTLDLEKINEATDSAKVDMATYLVADLKIEGFESVKPGEEKEFVYKPITEINMVGRDEPVIENQFANIKENGEHNFQIVLADRAKDSVIAKSDPFKIKVDVLREEGVYKACH